MKKIIFLLLIGILFGVASPLFAQSVSGTYKGVRIKVKYVSDPPNDDIREVKCNGEDLAKMVSRLDNLEAQIAEKDKDIKKLEKKIRDLSQGGEQGGGQTNNPNPNVVDSLRRHNNALLEEKWELEGQRNALRDSVQNLEKSVRLLNDSLDKVNKQLADLLKVKPTKNTSSHIGAYYRIGSPWLINDLLDSDLWNREVTSSHQVGLYWNSASFSDKLPMTFGVGLEYSGLKFSAGVGHFEETPFRDGDLDGDTCTTFLSYKNVTENAFLHYISIPLSFSIGAPRTDRISGYFQASLVTSVRGGENLKAINGTYSLVGHYDSISGSPVDFNLNNFPALGFCTDSSIVNRKNEASLCRIVVTGRLSGGVYIPLCNTAKGQTSRWSVKVGVNLDIAITRINKKVGNPFSVNDYQTNANYHLKQNDFLDPKFNCRYINPSLEVGILYMFNK